MVKSFKTTFPSLEEGLKDRGLTLIQEIIQRSRYTFKIGWIKNYNGEIIIRDEFITSILNLINLKSQAAKTETIYFSQREKVVNKFKLHIIKDIVENEATNKLSLKKIMKLYKERDNNFKFSIWALRKVLQEKLKYSYGTIETQNESKLTDKGKKMNTIYMNNNIQLIRDKHLIIFFDECTFKNTKHQMRTWYPRKKNKVLFSRAGVKKYNLLLAITSNKVMSWRITSKHTNNDGVRSFFHKLHTKIIKCPENLELLRKGKITVFLDNASYHRKIEFKRWITDIGFNLFYNVTYSPRYNFIEQIFAYLKRNFYREVFKKR